MAAAITVLPWRATRLLAAVVHRSARSVLGRLRSLVVRGRDRARATFLVAPSLPALPQPLRHRGGRVAQRKTCASPVARRGGNLPLLAHVSKPMLTNSGVKRRSGTKTTVKTAPAPAAAIAVCLVSPEVCSCDEDEQIDGGEEMLWESMFQDPRPT
ncbi:uncharacterized protein LOC133883221 [Phragmites australis]|uniref:uncharacterized protein LOC133883221 n=1 Tax=Phragmites australis TaxID=29695 RepID=UPI002D779905|nr:uncharacterized protein LOC133883221 [Phragmites australis]